MIRTVRLNTLSLHCFKCSRNTIHVIPVAGYKFTFARENGENIVFRDAICLRCGNSRFVSFKNKTNETNEAK